jgi:glycosyltransferase involved in cell wall biosynthesis
MTADAAASRSITRALPGATVLQILPSLINEPWARGAINIASALLRSGARAIIASEGGRYVGELQAIGGEWVRMMTATHNPFTLRANARRLYELIKTERIDVVHAYTGAAAWSARIATRSTEAWLVTTYAGAPIPRFQSGARFQRALARADRILADSAYAAELISAHYRVPPNWVVAVPRGIDTERFDPAVVTPERVAALRDDWRLSEGLRVILVPGVLVPEKGQMTAVDAMRILINGGMRRVVLVIAGEDDIDIEYTRDLVEHIRAQGLSGFIRRVRHCADMPAAYAMADMIVVPSSEPTTFSYVAAEAHAMGTPVIASAIGVLPEMVLAPPYVPEHERLGWLVPPSDSMELARAIAEVLSLDQGRRVTMQARARRFAEMFYSPARVAAATLAVYGALLQGGR